MLRLQAAALVGNEPQAAPLPGVWPWRCFSPRQKCRWIWFCPACYEASFSQLLLSPGESQRRPTSLSVELEYETGQERGAETRLLENLVPRVLGAGPQPWKSPCISYLPALTSRLPCRALRTHSLAHTHWHRMRAHHSPSDVPIVSSCSRPGKAWRHPPSSGSLRAPTEVGGLCARHGGLGVTAPDVRLGWE